MTRHALHAVPDPTPTLHPAVERAWDNLLDPYAVAAALDGIRPSTVGVHVAHCRDLMRRTAVPPDELDQADLAEWLDRPAWSYRTRKAHRASAHAVLSWAAAHGLLDTDPTDGVFASQLAPEPSTPAARDASPRPPIDLTGLTEHPARTWARRVGYPCARTGDLARDLLDAWAAAGSPRVDLVDNSDAALWARLLDEYESAARAAGLRGSTLQQRRFHLEHLARATGLTPEQLEPDDLIAWQGREDLSPAYRRSIRSSLRTVLGWAHQTGRLPTNPAEQLPSVRVPAGVPRPASEVAIRNAVNRASPKQRLMMLLAAYQGLRRGEIARLRLEDLTPGGWHIVGKGGRERLVPLHAALVDELRTYLEHTGIRSGWLFPNPDHSGPLSVAHIGSTTSRLLPRGVSLHRLRHRFASQAYASAYDIRSVQELLGHSSPSVTARYVAVPTPQLEATVLAVPPIPGIARPPQPENTDRHDDPERILP